MTQTIKTITIGYMTLELPASMSNKDIQQLAGYLATLRRVESIGLYADTYRNISYVESSGLAITLNNQETYTKDEALQLGADDKLAREAKEKETELAREAKEKAAA